MRENDAQSTKAARNNAPMRWIGPSVALGGGVHIWWCPQNFLIIWPPSPPLSQSQISWFCFFCLHFGDPPPPTQWGRHIWKPPCVKWVSPFPFSSEHRSPLSAFTHSHSFPLRVKRYTKNAAMGHGMGSMGPPMDMGCPKQQGGVAISMDPSCKIK